MARARVYVFIPVCLAVILHVINADSDDAKSCTTYTAKLTSIPDLTHNIVYQARRKSDFIIEDVKSTNYQRSYYWCQLDIKESNNVFKRYRHFGFNTTHWWVEKGCGGWFIVTECKPGDGVIVHDIVGLQDNADQPQQQRPGGAGTMDLNDSEKKTIDNPVDALYQGWPKLGYHFPTSEHMWDILDKATWVDVPEQLGFYKTYRKPRSVAFD